MEKLVTVINLLADKYKDVESEVDKDLIRIKVKNMQDVIEVTENSGKLHVKVLPSCFNEDIDLVRLEDIINILQKQANTPPKTDVEIEEIKLQYKQGMTIKLKKMYDLQAPNPETIGMIDFVDDSGTIHMRWENGSSLGLVVGLDEFSIIDDVENDG